MRKSLPALLLATALGAWASLPAQNSAAGSGEGTYSWTGATLYGGHKEQLEVVITRGRNGYEVSGSLSLSQVCQLHGTYYPASGRLRGRCEGPAGRLNLEGTRLPGGNGFNVTIDGIEHIALAQETTQPDTSQESPKGPHWEAHDVSDCSGDDIGTSSGADRPTASCSASNLGQVAIGWDGWVFKNAYGESHGAPAYPWCTYKSAPQCGGGHNPGRMYICEE